MRRKRSCELCGEAAGAHPLDLGTRLVTLCQPHTHQAEQAGVTTLEALRALFVEASGQRSLLTRRAASERRLFPPRPEGRRQWRGRRQSDAGSAAVPAATPAHVPLSTAATPNTARPAKRLPSGRR